MNSVSISEIVAKNYKNIRLENGIEFGDLTVLVGANGSGKSNLISLFGFLQDSVAGTIADDQRGRTNFEDAVFELGGARILDGALEAPANVGIEYHFAIDQEEATLGIDLLVQGNHRQVIVGSEYLDSGRGLSTPPAYYRVHSGEYGGGGSGVVSVYSHSEAVTRILAQPPTQLVQIRDVPVNELALAAMPRLLEGSRIPPEAVPLYGPRGKIVDAALYWSFYNANNMDLERIKASLPKLGRSDLFLSETGENLALVLFNLIQEDIEFESTINEAIRDVLPFTRRIRGVPIGSYALTIEWHVEGCSEPFYLNEMSDGTIRMLTWAVILHSPSLPTLIVIEEPELGIHPAWMPILAEWIRGAAQRTQVIVSTHSPDLLDSFTDQLDNGGSIYAFQPDNERRSHFTPSRITESAVTGWLEEGWQLGDLYRVGNPAVGGWPW